MGKRSTSNRLPTVHGKTFDVPFAMTQLVMSGTVRLVHRAGAGDDKKTRSETSDGIEAISLVFPPRLAHKAPRLPTPIYKNDPERSASQAVSQVANGCAAQDSGQLLMFEGKTCSLFRAFTTYVLFLVVSRCWVKRGATQWMPQHGHEREK